MKTLLSLLAAGMIANSPALAEETPTEVVEAYCAALKKNDLFGVSGLMHTDSLEEFKGVWHTFIVENYDTPMVAPLLNPYTHGERRSAVEVYSARKVFERFLETALSFSPPLRQALQGADFKVLNTEIIAGTALVEVEYQFDVGGQKRTQTDKLRLRKDGLDWRVLVSADLNEVAKKLSRLSDA